MSLQKWKMVLVMVIYFLGVASASAATVLPTEIIDTLIDQTTGSPFQPTESPIRMETDSPDDEPFFTTDSPMKSTDSPLETFFTTDPSIIELTGSPTESDSVDNQVTEEYFEVPQRVEELNSTVVSNHWTYNDENPLEDGTLIELTYEISYAGKRNFYHAYLYKNGFLELPDLLGNLTEGIRISAFVNAESTDTESQFMYFEEIDYVVAINYGILQNEALIDYQDQIYGGYLATWVFSDNTISQVVILFNVDASLILEVRNLGWIDSNTESILDNYQASTLINKVDCDCASIYQARDIFTDSNYSQLLVHDRSEYLECETSFSSSYCVDIDPPSTNPDVDTSIYMSFVFRTASMSFGEMQGKLTCPEGQSLVMISNNRVVNDFGYELHTCVYDSDRYVSSWSPGEYVCSDFEFLAVRFQIFINFLFFQYFYKSFSTFFQPFPSNYRRHRHSNCRRNDSYYRITSYSSCTCYANNRTSTTAINNRYTNSGHCNSY